MLSIVTLTIGWISDEAVRAVLLLCLFLFVLYVFLCLFVLSRSSSSCFEKEDNVTFCLVCSSLVICRA